MVPVQMRDRDVFHVGELEASRENLGDDPVAGVDEPG